jgi:hypothetical protein
MFLAAPPGSRGDVGCSPLLALAAVLLASGAARAATSTRLVDPDSYTCPSSGFVDFEDFADGTDLSAESFPGIEFSTTNGFTWRVGDFAAGGYNGKYPSGIYTSKGTHWAWLGASQGSGRIDLTQGAASSFSLLVSANSGIYLEAYDDGGALLESAGPSAATTNSSQMAELRVTRATADIGYVIVHDSGNYFVVDGVCSDARGVGDKDTDGDGISDRWERDGADVDGDGRVDLDLPGMGADPLRRARQHHEPRHGREVGLAQRRERDPQRPAGPGLEELGADRHVPRCERRPRAARRLPLRGLRRRDPLW